MGWRLLKWFWRPAAVTLVLARPGRVIKAAAPRRTIFASIQEYPVIRPFGPKDPDEVDWINFDFSARLLSVSDTIASIVGIVIEAGDSVLTLDQFVEDAGVVSARWQAGTLGSTYTLRCRVATAGGRTWDLSGTVTIAQA